MLGRFYLWCQHWQVHDDALHLSLVFRSRMPIRARYPSFSVSRRIPAMLLVVVVTALAVCACQNSSEPGSDSASGAVAKDGWIGAWAAAPYGPYPLGPLSETLPADLPPIPTLFVNDHASDQSFRMIVHPTIGGDQVRVRLSNLMGDRPVTFEPVHIARSLLVTGPTLVPGSDVPVLFGGQSSITIAPGAEAISDPTAFSYQVGDDLAISFHVVGESGPITWHALAFNPNYISLPGVGDTTADLTGLSFTQPSLGWFFISGVDVLAPDSAGTMVALGDSITDGAYTVLNTRWTDDFERRLRDAGVAMGVLNEGINSNTVTEEGIDSASAYQGPAAVDRFARDVLQRPGVRSIVILEGTNDLAAGVSADAVFAGIRSMVKRAKAAGLCVVVGTIMPRRNTPLSPWDAATDEPQRQALNAAIRAQTDIDGIADFDAAMASPLDPTQPNLLLYFVDQLHPTPLGTQVMANAVPLQALVPPPVGTCGG